MRIVTLQSLGHILLGDSKLLEAAQVDDELVADEAAHALEGNVISALQSAQQQQRDSIDRHT